MTCFLVVAKGTSSCFHVTPQSHVRRGLLVCVLALCRCVCGERVGEFVGLFVIGFCTYTTHIAFKWWLWSLCFHAGWSSLQSHRGRWGDRGLSGSFSGGLSTGVPVYSPFGGSFRQIWWSLQGLSLPAQDCRWPLMSTTDMHHPHRVSARQHNLPLSSRVGSCAWDDVPWARELVQHLLPESICPAEIYSRKHGLPANMCERLHHWSPLWS